MRPPFQSDSLTDTEKSSVSEALAEVINESPDGDPISENYDELVKKLGSDLCHRGGIYVIPKTFKLSVVIPIYNEVKTLEEVVRKVRSIGLNLEMVLVDDGSTDGTRELLGGMHEDDDLKIVFHDQNKGKGAAVRTGFQEATGDVIVIQDADLEYDPNEFRYLLQPIIEDRAESCTAPGFKSKRKQILRPGIWPSMVLSPGFATL